MTANYSPVGEKRVQKGSLAPARILDPDQTPCPAISTETEVVTHVLVNIDDYSTICQTCGLDWATLDQKIRDEAQRVDKGKEAARDAAAKARNSRGAVEGAT